MSELRGIFIPKLEAMYEAITDAQTIARTSYPIDLRLAKAYAFLLSGHISILERVK